MTRIRSWLLQKAKLVLSEEVGDGVEKQMMSAGYASLHHFEPTLTVRSVASDAFHSNPTKMG